MHSRFARPLRRLVPTLVLFIVATLTGGAPAHADSFAALREEFSAVGPASFAAGSTETEAMHLLKPVGAKAERFEVAGQPFTHAVRLHVAERQKHEAHNNLQVRNQVPLSRGQTLLVVYWARGDKGSQFVDDGAGAVIQPFLKSHIDAFRTRYGNTDHLDPEEWRRFWFYSDPLPRDYAPGEIELLMMAGHKAQTVEVGAVAWLVFPPGAERDRLPRRVWTYEGRDPAAPWRAEAARRIDRHRKADLAVRVLDADGRPAPDARIHVSMTRHAFPFGTAVSLPAWNGLQGRMSAADRELYREISSRYFNAIGPENDLKWKHWLPYTRGEDRSRPAGTLEDMLRFYKNQGKQVRGHVLVWPSFFHTPAEIREAYETTKDKEALRRAIHEHITAIVSRYAGIVDAWDVTNETRSNRDFMDIFGAEEMTVWYRLAKRADPHARLVYNERKDRVDEGWISGSFEDFGIAPGVGWVGYLQRQGAPVDALGTQAHYGLAAPELTWRRWDELWERFRLPLEITELDIGIEDDRDPDQLAWQADKLRDSLTIAFAHPMISAIQQWGFWQGAHWKSGAALWRRDWTIKPNGQAYLDLVFKTWWTDETLTTNADGEARVRGFLGDYTVAVTVGETTTTVSATLDADGEAIVVKLP
jgi:GH35 family endo-1,4-beta-xylanase